MITPEVKHRKARKIPETITEVELKMLLESTKSRKKYQRLAYLMAFYEGMRVSEIIHLQPENIDTRQRLLHIKNAKGHKDRNIPIAPQVLYGLKHIPFKCTVRALEISFKKLCKEVLGKDLHFHCLRHSSATYYLNEKHWDIRQVQALLGHSRITTTEIYTHVRPEDLITRMWDNFEEKK